MTAFEMFSAAHLWALIGAFLVFTCLIVGRSRLREPKISRIIRYVLALMLLSCEVSLQLFYVGEQEWGVNALPLQLCSMLLLLSVIVLLWNVKRLYPVVLFLGSMGALQALLTPNLDYTFPHFRYFQFFLAHIGIIGAALFITAVEGYRPTFRSLLVAMLWLNILALPAAAVNIVTGTTNFMFLAGKPSSASLLDLLAPWPWYLLQLEAVAFAICWLLYLLLSLLTRVFGKRKAVRT
ncbi:Integral membrane protein [compost metagenome]